MYSLSLFLSGNLSVFQNKSGDGYCAAYPVMSVNRSSGLSVNISSVVFPVSPFIQFFITKASLGNYWTVALRIRLCFHLSVKLSMHSLLLYLSVGLSVFIHPCQSARPFFITNASLGAVARIGRLLCD